MKKERRFTILCLCIVCMLLPGCTITQWDWKKAQKIDTQEAYQEFLQKHPQSEYEEAAQKAIENLEWEETSQVATIEAYKSFLSRYPQSEYRETAKNALHQLEWKRAETMNTIQEYKLFLAKYPQSEYKGIAETSIETLEWKSTQTLATIEAYEKFLENYPHSNYRTTAQQHLETLEWKEAQIINTAEAYENFLAKYPRSEYRVIAQNTLEELAWEYAQHARSIDVYMNFLATYPESHYSHSAHEDIKGLEQEFITTVLDPNSSLSDQLGAVIQIRDRELLTTVSDHITSHTSEYDYHLQEALEIRLLLLNPIFTTYYDDLQLNYEYTRELKIYEAFKYTCNLYIEHIRIEIHDQKGKDIVTLQFDGEPGKGTETFRIYPDSGKCESKTHAASVDIPQVYRQLLKKVEVDSHTVPQAAEGLVVVYYGYDLMWQQSGSPGSMKWEKAQDYIDQINEESYAGYSDWRLPTIEELVLLLEPERQSHNLYIDPEFDNTQTSCWTATPGSDSSQVWVVNFYDDSANLAEATDFHYVRAVRSSKR